MNVADEIREAIAAYDRDRDVDALLQSLWEIVGEVGDRPVPLLLDSRHMAVMSDDEYALLVAGHTKKILDLTADAIRRPAVDDIGRGHLQAVPS